MISSLDLMYGSKSSSVSTVEGTEIQAGGGLILLLIGLRTYKLVKDNVKNPLVTGRQGGKTSIKLFCPVFASQC